MSSHPWSCQFEAKFVTMKPQDAPTEWNCPEREACMQCDPMIVLLRVQVFRMLENEFNDEFVNL